MMNHYRTAKKLWTITLYLQDNLMAVYRFREGEKDEKSNYIWDL